MAAGRCPPSQRRDKHPVGIYNTCGSAWAWAHDDQAAQTHTYPHYTVQHSGIPPSSSRVGEGGFEFLGQYSGRMPRSNSITSHASFPA